MADASVEDAGHLDGLAKALSLSMEEMVELSYAYTFERRLEETLAENTNE
jgi:hypothetical protein